ncbi:hypothetical protein G0U57_002426, partial [Chelydra serpentina]
MHGKRNRPVAYFSATLDPVAQGLPPCLCAVATAACLVEMSDSLVLRSPLTLLVPHSVETLLLQCNTGHLSSAHLIRYELLLLSASYITVKRCSQLNPATLLPLSNDGDPHDCLTTVSAVTVPRSDLSDVPLPNSDLVLFTDGSCFRNNQGRLLAEYTVVSLSETLEAAPLPSVTPAQVAKLVALTCACFLVEGRSATIYTNSRYAFGVVHDFGTLWQTRGFLTSAGTPIKNGPYSAALLYAVLLPSALAIVKCPGHSMADTHVAKGNAFADTSAKHAAAIKPSPDAFLGSLSVSIPPPSLTNLTLLQDSAPKTKKESWVAHGCSLRPDSLWCSPTGAFVAPFSLYPSLATLLHGVPHVGKEGMVSAVTKTGWLAPHFSSFAAGHCAACTICQSHNIGKPVKVVQGFRGLPQAPFLHRHLYKIKLPKCQQYKFILVMVCLFPGWIKAFPCHKADSLSVAKCLLNHIMPAKGIPATLSSDQGTHFTGQLVQHLDCILHIKHLLHCPYHPQSAGAVERRNGVLKNKLANICDST